MTGRLVAGVWVAVVFGYLILPTLVVALMSFGRDDVLRFPPTLFSTQWYAAFASSEEWTGALVRSVGIGLGTAIGATVVGTAGALSLVRGRLPFRRAFGLLAISPMIIPPIVLAVGGYGLFSRLRLVGNPLGLVVVDSVLAEPFVVLLVSAALHRTDGLLELASASLGAGRWRTLREITLPLIAPAIITSALFAFLTSFDEVVLALFLIGTVTTTLPIKIFAGLTFGVTPIVAAVSTLMVLISVLVIGASGGVNAWHHRRQGRLQA